MLPYEWRLGLRYLGSTHRRGFLSFISIVSVAGLAIGVAVLIVVLAVMHGFKVELERRILSVTANAELEGLNGTLPKWRSELAVAQRMPGVTAAVPYISEQALLMHGHYSTGVRVRGVDPAAELRAVGIARHIEGGNIRELVSGGYRIILGDRLARALDVGIGGRVVLVAPGIDVTLAGPMPRMRAFRVVGLFHSGMYEYDRGLALVALGDAARIYQLGGAVTGIRLALRDPFQAHELVRSLALKLGGGFYVSDWTLQHANFFRSIQTTKSMLFVILLLVVAVAAFNIVSALVMVVKDKQADIAILRTLGAAPGNVLAAFSVLGTLIGFTGIAAGAALGLLLSANLTRIVAQLERLLGTNLLNAKVYLMGELPAIAQPGDVLRICALAFVLCALATLYPAWRASKVQPAEALRHD